MAAKPRGSNPHGGWSGSLAHNSAGIRDLGTHFYPPHSHLATAVTREEQVTDPQSFLVCGTKYTD